MKKIKIGVLREKTIDILVNPTRRDPNMYVSIVRDAFEIETLSSQCVIYTKTEIEIGFQI